MEIFKERRPQQELEGVKMLAGRPVAEVAAWWSSWKDVIPYLVVLFIVDFLGV